MMISKKIIFALIFSVGSLNLFAQTQTSADFNYSVGVNVFSMMQMPKVLDQTNYQDYTKTYGNGLIFKFNDNQINYRIKGTYYRGNLSFKNNCETCEVSDGKLQDFGIKLGFEKNFNYARVQPYFAFDIGYRSSSYKGDISAIGSNTFKETLNNSKNGFVMAPTLGIKVNIIPALSVFAESSIDFYYSYEKQQRTGLTKTVNTYNKWEFLLSPVTAGLIFNINKKN